MEYIWNQDLDIKYDANGFVEDKLIFFIWITNPTFSSRWTDITKDNKNDRETRKEHNINLNRPNIPNFDDDPARNDDIDVFTSQCTSGDR